MPELWGDCADGEVQRRLEQAALIESIIFWGLAFSSITFIIVISIMAVS